MSYPQNMIFHKLTISKQFNCEKPITMCQPQKLAVTIFGVFSSTDFASISLLLFVPHVLQSLPHKSLLLLIWIHLLSDILQVILTVFEFPNLKTSTKKSKRISWLPSSGTQTAMELLANLIADIWHGSLLRCSFLLLWRGSPTFLYHNRSMNFSFSFFISHSHSFLYINIHTGFG